MSFTGNENHDITLKDASEMTKAYRDAKKPADRLGGFFGQAAIQRILSQQGCVGIRYYYGLDKDGKQVLVLTGVDTSQNDLYEGFLAEISYPCPNYCSTSNPLNTDPA